MNETGHLEACTIQVLQPLRKARQERVLDQVRNPSCDQVRPLMILSDEPVVPLGDPPAVLHAPEQVEVGHPAAQYQVVGARQAESGVGIGQSAARTPADLAVKQLPRLIFERHARQQVLSPLLRRQYGIQVRMDGGIKQPFLLDNPRTARNMYLLKASSLLRSADGIVRLRGFAKR